MEFIKKGFDFFKTYPSVNCTYQKPSICPHCGISCDGRVMSHHHYALNNLSIVFFIFQCTSCNKLFTATYRVEDRKSTFCGMTPQNISSFSDSLIEQTSPRFIETYNQALRARDNGDLNLAAIGYRTAIEILVKDYAINELQKPREEVVKKKLFPAIKEYLSKTAFVNTADVIRILGNDHTHYERKYPDLDFNLLQEYMDIFIGLIRARLLIAHPPVSRRPKV